MAVRTAADIVAGDVVEFATMAWLAGEVTTEGDEVKVTWGNRTVTYFHQDERVTILKPH